MDARRHVPRLPTSARRLSARAAGRRAKAGYTARRMRAVDIIISKRDGHTLGRDEIRFFVEGVTAGTLPDYQASALLMAILLRGMNAEETAWLTDAWSTRGSASISRRSRGVKVDKHSTSARRRQDLASARAARGRVRRSRCR